MINDLLDTKRMRLSVVDDPTRGVRVKGLSQAHGTSPQHCMELVRNAEYHRKYVQWRSDPRRAALSTTILSLCGGGGERGGEGRGESCLFIVDLASSSGGAPDDSPNLSKGLFTLRTIVSRRAAAAPSPSTPASLTAAAARLPFRDSKVTRILKPCLDGTGSMFVICTLSPTGTASW